MRCSIRTDIIKPKVVTYGYFVNATKKKKRNILLGFTTYSARTARNHVKCMYPKLCKVPPMAAEITDKGTQTYSSIFTDIAWSATTAVTDLNVFFTAKTKKRTGRQSWSWYFLSGSQIRNRAYNCIIGYTVKESLHGFYAFILSQWRIDFQSQRQWRCQGLLDSRWLLCPPPTWGFPMMQGHWFYLPPFTRDGKTERQT